MYIYIQIYCATFKILIYKLNISTKIVTKYVSIFLWDVLLYIYLCNCICTCMYICYDSSLLTESYVKDCKGLPGIPILLFNEISTLKKDNIKIFP